MSERYRSDDELDFYELKKRHDEYKSRQRLKTLEYNRQARQDGTRRGPAPDAPEETGRVPARRRPYIRREEPIAEETAQEAPAPRPGRTDPAVTALLEKLEREVCALPDFIRDQRFFLQGEWLYCAPVDAPSPEGLRVIAPGLFLLRAGRSHIEPAHALAMALPPEDALRTAELDDARAAAWLRGEALAHDGARGWTLALWRGMPLGWGKVSEGQLKNHLPKGLRRP